ncbi:MAG TPA: arginine deiminase family protein [Hypericibacter adhaerens]|jgi:N-dimethylarginine dimethylaminohydrolase|uniref:dimethylarginine dimethylaminohydrolase family protein n=1 Tax=Hypericibacter adhaerens TaxID=2602016 RepID=UPI002C11D498|nr:arginine deiminase family protein [Hypericibacter adhaerens]HWA44505.1 arginine deiminase family protein [Hypericibacter adhaerens]
MLRNYPGIISEEDFRYHRMISIFASEPEPPFESVPEQTEIWGRRWGCSNDVGRLRVVLMHRPGDELNRVDVAKTMPEIGGFGDPKTGWYWRGTEGPNLAAMQEQHDRLTALLEQEGVEVVRLKRTATGRMKSCYTRDSCIAVKGGAIVTRLGARVRRGEERPVAETLIDIGCPILRTMSGNAIFEGGSFAWIDSATAVAAISSRGNMEGVRQLEEVLRSQDVKLLVISVPGYRLHIDGAFVMVDRDTALINPTQLPFDFLTELKERKIRLIDVHPEDSVWTINCLALRPGRVVMSEGVSPRTVDRLGAAGIEVVMVPYANVTSGGGGIHCSTSPLVRDDL